MGTIEIIDPEGERRERWQRRVFAAFFFIGILILAYPIVSDYSSKWKTLKVANQFALFLTSLRTQAVTKKVPIEAVFQNPDLIDVYEVSSCGPNSIRKKLWSTTLAEFSAGVHFASEQWVRENHLTSDPVFHRYCYDPYFGSSVAADGLSHGSVVLAHQSDLELDRGDKSVSLQISGPSADLTID